MYRQWGRVVGVHCSEDTCATPRVSFVVLWRHLVNDFLESQARARGILVYFQDAAGEAYNEEM